MPGRIFAKIGRSGYIGQVVTAGILLTAAALIMFAVISTLEPAEKPPAAKKVPVAESRQQAQAETADSLLTNSTASAESSPAPQPPTQVVVPVKAAVGESNAVVESQAISELASGTITRNFGWQFHPVYQDWRYNNGLDISGGEGQIVPALKSGKVVEIYTDRQYGRTVAVKSEGYIIYYSALASIAVEDNAIIKAGKPIGSMGITLSEPEPHLHLAVQTQDKKEYLDPQTVFRNISK